MNKKNIKEGILYLIFGFITVLITILVYKILVITILNPNNPLELQIANIISWIIAVLFAFLTNKNIVFEDKKGNDFKQFFEFISMRIITLLLDMGIMFLGVSILKIDDLIIKVLSQFIVIVLNYIFSKFIIFNK